MVQAREHKSVFSNNYKWCVTFENCESPHCHSHDLHYRAATMRQYNFFELFFLVTENNM